MTTFATLSDLLEQEPNIQDYGLLDWSQELASAQTEVTRHIAVRWWPQYARGTSIDIRFVNAGGATMDETLLDPTQWTKATVYYCLAHQICPKLTKFDVEGDRFQVMMDYYARRYETEFDIALREGVRYDSDQNSVFSTTEKNPVSSLRLKR
jgi:hypothetical protein